MDIAQATLLVAIMRTPGIFGITPESLTALGLQESAEALSRLVNAIPTIVIVVVITHQSSAKLNEIVQGQVEIALPGNHVDEHGRPKRIETPDVTASGISSSKPTSYCHL